MVIWSELTEKEKKEIIDHVCEWYDKHSKHVNELIDSETEYCYPPSGSDMARPELFKPAHWRWFKQTGALDNET